MEKYLLFYIIYRIIYNVWLFIVHTCLHYVLVYVMCLMLGVDDSFLRGNRQFDLRLCLILLVYDFVFVCVWGLVRARVRWHLNGGLRTPVIHLLKVGTYWPSPRASIYQFYVCAPTKRKKCTCSGPYLGHGYIWVGPRVCPGLIFKNDQSLPVQD